ncbi:MAG: GTPase HflX, partial [Methylovirgula sp.]
LVDAEKMLALHNAARRQPATARAIAVSALTGQGIDELVVRLEARLAADHVVLNLHVESNDGRGRNWLYEHTEVLSRSELADGSLDLSVSAAPALVGKLREKFAPATPAAARRQPRR